MAPPLKSNLKTCLTIAGSDPSGGAGIQADLRVFQALGVYGVSAVTSLTSQNTLGVQSLYPISADFIGKQLESLFSDISVDAIKIGMMVNADIMLSVVEKIKEYIVHREIPIVVDPILVSSSGYPLLDIESKKFFLEKLLPLATVLTPNIPEAVFLLEKKIESQRDMELACKQLCDFGVKAVVLKGGHSENKIQCNDFLFYPSSIGLSEIWFQSNRIETKNTHGTGCVFSSALCSFLSMGLSYPIAVEKAKKFLTQSLTQGKLYSLGQGHGPAFFL
jgi:hydroxymethylpyrimidine/phosphomethylpyrimidine kinase